MSPFFAVFVTLICILCYLLQLSLKKKNQTSKQKALPCQKKNSKGKNELDSDGFPGKGIERGHGTKLLCKIRHSFS